MSEWVLDLSQINMKEIVILQLLAELNSPLTLAHLSTVCAKAGVDFEDVPIAELPNLMAAFHQQLGHLMSQGRSSWPGIWSTWNE